MPSLETTARRIAEEYEPPAIGRPSELGDRHTVTHFLRAVRAGNYMETACAIAGLSKQTVYRWLREADNCTDQNDPRVTFRDAVEKARAASEAEDVANVRRAGKSPQFWAASATYLERRYPDRWGKRPDSDAGPRVTVILGTSTEHAVQVLDPSNHNASYQTQSNNECLIPPTLTDLETPLNQAKVLGESISTTVNEPRAGTRENP